MEKLVALAAVLAGCSSASAADFDATPYSCAAITAAPQITHTDSAVIAPWRELAEAEVLDPSWVAHVQARASVAPGRLSIQERVRLQHQLLEVAQRIDGARRGNPAWPAWHTAQARVTALIHAIAPTAGELATLGDGAHPEVASILGTELTERATKTCAGGKSIHANAFHGTLAFRPLRAGETRALVAQLVAIDRDGNPHVTPLVDGIELRTGSEVSSPACVVEAGDDGVLRTVPQADLHEHGMFVRKRGDGVGCVNCHRGSNTMNARDLNALELPAIDRARDGQVHGLASELWTRLRDEQ